MISQIYYPKYNVVLINSNNIFIDAFVCFLDSIYTTPPDNLKETKILLNSCLYTYFLKILKSTSASYTQYINVVFYYNINFQDVNIEIFKYINKNKFFNIINNFILKNKNIFLFYKNNKKLSFNNGLISKITITGEEQEILNVINKKLMLKPTLT